MKAKFLIIFGIFLTVGIVSPAYNSNALEYPNLVQVYNVENNFEITHSSLVKQPIQNTNSIGIGTCTIQIDIELENGTIIEGEVTITGDEMNWFKCAALKIYDFFSSAF